MNDLSPLLSQPGTSIAVIGATDHPTKYGGIIYRDMKGKGFPVFAVNPYRQTVDGDPCWPTVEDLPETPTIAVFVIPARRGLKVLEECAEAGIRNIWIQPGAFSPELGEALEAGDFDWLANACVMVRARVAAV
ncbi:MAG TPA: CoA-binding protein [Acidimicrobiia bacterium]|nr:CoA-binding protein [Acidimicrobiia bacterium]